MQDITEPLIMSVGSHKKGSGRGCVMNVISWCDGDEVITDFPKSVHQTIARLLQIVNDAIGSEEPDDVVPARYAGRLLDIAFAARGTGKANWYWVDSFLVSREGIVAAPFLFDSGKISADDWLDLIEDLVIAFKQTAGLDSVTPPSAATVNEALAKMAQRVDA